MPLYMITEATRSPALEPSVYICDSNSRTDHKVPKNDTYEYLQVYPLCQHYEGNNLQ